MSKTKSEQEEKNVSLPQNRIILQRWFECGLTTVGDKKVSQRQMQKLYVYFPLSKIY